MEMLIKCLLITDKVHRMWFMDLTTAGEIFKKTYSIIKPEYVMIYVPQHDVRVFSDKFHLD